MSTACGRPQRGEWDQFMWTEGGGVKNLIFLWT